VNRLSLENLRAAAEVRLRKLRGFSNEGFHLSGVEARFPTRPMEVMCVGRCRQAFATSGARSVAAAGLVDCRLKAADPQLTSSHLVVVPSVAAAAAARSICELR
jgi:hypothetical protein